MSTDQWTATVLATLAALALVIDTFAHYNRARRAARKAAK